MTPPAAPSSRSTDLGLARLHLRLGALAIARAELETLAGRDALDDDGLLDLAEVRWRTGDLVGAGEAADAILRGKDGQGPLLAFVIAAEASMSRGRPTEARRLAGQVLAADRAAVDRLFAGMPRSAVWPADPVELPPSGMTMFDAAALGGGAAIESGEERATADTPADATTTTPAPVAAGAMGLWDAGGAGDATAPDDTDAETPEPTLPVAGQALADGRTAIVDGQPAEAAVRLGLALRLDPTLAPAVLELLGDSRAPELALTRGDAYRVLGREAEARRAYADAVPTAAPEPSPDTDIASVPEPPPASEAPPPEGDPA